MIVFKRYLVLISLIGTFLLPFAVYAAFDFLIEFDRTASGQSLNHGDAILGTEWLEWGIRFDGVDMRMIDDATCSTCLAVDDNPNANVLVTFELDGLPAVTDLIHINYVGSGAAFTVIRDIDENVLFEGPGDVSQFLAPNIASVKMVSLGNGVDAVGFNQVTRDLLLNGPVPGLAGEVNTLHVTGGGPGETVHFVAGTVAGSTDVPECPGLTVEIGDPRMLGTGVVDGSGGASISETVSGGASGVTARLQAVEQSSCRVSNLVIYNFP